jgi:hypothetical protein|tara:strand:+ start:147 stop:326 length:180 start_codon:yes stop_codon:yes gene_type:complete
MSQLKSNTLAFIETDQYGTRKPKKNKIKERLRIAVKGVVWKRVPGSFSPKLKKSKQGKV